jgi:hypothetical protein
MKINCFTLTVSYSPSVRSIPYDSFVRVLNTGLNLSCLVYPVAVLVATADKTGRFQM